MTVFDNKRSASFWNNQSVYIVNLCIVFPAEVHFHSFVYMSSGNRFCNKLDLFKQIEFITKPIPAAHIHKRMKMNLCREDYTQVDYVYRLIVPKGSASFIIKDRHIEILAQPVYSLPGRGSFSFFCVYEQRESVL